MNEWIVRVMHVGTIGTVHERNEELARCAALSKFGEDRERGSDDEPSMRPRTWTNLQFQRAELWLFAATG
jgi:hypothetical protein